MGLFDLPDLAGLKIVDGRYELGTVLGERQGAVTVSATDSNEGQSVVVRVFPGHGGRIRETAALREKLTHTRSEWLVSYSYAAEVEEPPQLSANLVVVRPQGIRSLTDLSADGLTAAIPQTIRTIVFNVANGLKTLHSSSLVHGNLIPGNILLFQDRWQLADFSLTSFVDQDIVPSRPRSHLQFAAPEVLRGDPVKASSDVYALGEICNWLVVHLSAENLFERSSEFVGWRELIDAMVDDRPQNRPTIDVVHDLLFDDAALTRRRISTYLASSDLVRTVSGEIEAIVPPGIIHKMDRAHKFYGMSKIDDRPILRATRMLQELQAEFDRRPYLAVQLLSSDRLPHYVGIWTIAKFGGAEYPDNRMQDRLDALRTTKSARMAKQIALGLDSAWRDEILERFELFQHTSASDYLDQPEIETLPQELRDALDPPLEELVAYLKRELDSAEELRVEILANEELLTDAEASALVKSAQASRDDEAASDAVLREMEELGEVFSLQDHDSRLYPAFQFAADGRVYSAVSAVNTLFAGSSGWSRLVWWRRHHPDLGAAPKDVLSEESWDRIIAAAKRSIESV